MRTKPPFRAEHVGSLLRPPEIKDARAKLERGEVNRADLKADRGQMRPPRRREAGGARF